MFLKHTIKLTENIEKLSELSEHPTTPHNTPQHLPTMSAITLAQKKIQTSGDPRVFLETLGDLGLLKESVEEILAREELVDFFNTKKTTRKKTSTDEERLGQYDENLCDARLWKEKPRSGGLGYDNIQCSSKKVDGCDCLCKKHFKMHEAGKLWTGLITKPRPEHTIHPTARPGYVPMSKMWSTDRDGNDVAVNCELWQAHHELQCRGQGKVTRGWTKVMDHTAYIGQANGFQGRCPPDWALELAMSCNTLKPKSKINSCLSDEEWIQKQGVAGRAVLHEWAEPLIKEANEYGGYITAQRATMVECWIRVQTRNPNDLLLNMTPEKGSVVYLSPGASIDFIRNSGFACVWSDDEESNDSLIGEQYSEAEDAKHRDAYQELD